MICKGCQIEFNPNVHNQIFHSEYCSNKWHYSKRDKEKELLRQRAERVVISKKATKSNQPYSKKDIKYIKKNFNTKRIIDIALALRRPIAGVKAKICQVKKELELEKEYAYFKI